MEDDELEFGQDDGMGGAPMPEMGGENIDMEEPDFEEEDNEEGDDYEDGDKKSPEYRGKVLMQRALDQLEKGNYEEFEIDRKMANEYFDKMNEEEEEMDALYNESRNFGIIYNVFEANVPHLLETKAGKKSFRKIVNAIKGNKILHEQFRAYNNLLPSNKIENAEEYINEAIRIAPKFNRSKVKKVNENLIRLMKKEKLDEMILIDDDKLDLYESIEYVTMHKKCLKNIDKYTNAKKVIKESIEKLPQKVNDKEVIRNYAKSIEEMSEKLSSELTTSEMKLVKEATGKDGEKYFNDCKNNTLKVLKETMNKEESMETKSRISSIHEKINGKAFDKKNAAIDIAEMIEIQHMLKD